MLPLPTARSTIATPGTVQDPLLASALDKAARRYWDVQNAVYEDPKANAGLIATAATGQTAKDLAYQGQQVIDKGFQVTGGIDVVRTNVASVTPSPIVGGQAATAVVKTCNDVSGLAIKNADGSAGKVDPTRLDQNQATLTLTNADPSDASGWLVSDLVQGPAIPCDSAS